MPTHLRLERLRTMSLAQYFLGLAAFSTIFWTVVLLRFLTGLSWLEITILVGTLVILTAALVWSLSEIKRLNR